MTTIEIERADTGEMAPVYQVPAAAADQRWLPTVPPDIVAYRQRLAATRLPRRPRHSVPAYDYGRLIGQWDLPTDRAAHRDVRLHMRVGYEHLRQSAQDWEDYAFWLHERQQIPGPQHRDVTTPLVQAYQRERDALIRGLPAAAPLPELHPARELAPDRLDDDHARRVAIAQQRQHRDALAPLATTQVAASEPTSNETAAELDAEPDGWVRSTRLRRALARIVRRET